MNCILQLWDVLLVSPPALLFFIGIAILKQYKAHILTLDFNGIKNITTIPYTKRVYCIVFRN
jgi:hypothetical protein